MVFNFLCLLLLKSEWCDSGFYGDQTGLNSSSCSGECPLVIIAHAVLEVGLPSLVIRLYFIALSNHQLLY